jgi:hypothetical protein
MPWRQIAALVLAAVVGACAAASPGYQPPNPKLAKMQAAVPRGGGFDAAGTYSLTEQELALDCKRINGSITIKILQMRAAGQRVQPSAVAAGAQSASQAVFGGTTYGRDLDADLKQDRARLEALNRRLGEKNCPTYDLDAELVQGNTNPPKPVKAGKKV